VLCILVNTVFRLRNLGIYGITCLAEDWFYGLCSSQKMPCNSLPKCSVAIRLSVFYRVVQKNGPPGLF